MWSKKFVLLSALLFCLVRPVFSEDVLVPEALYLELIELFLSNGNLYDQDSTILNNSNETIQNSQESTNQIGLISENLNENLNSSEDILNSSNQTTNNLDETMQSIEETNNELKKSSLKSILTTAGIVLGSFALGVGTGFLIASF